MSKSMTYTVTAGLAWLALTVSGAAVAGGMTGYLSDVAGVAKNPYGECYKDRYWTKSQAIEQCDPDLVPKPVVETAAMEAPAPMVVKKQISIQADTQFAFDSATLTPKGRQTLDELATNVRQAEEGTKIRITGYADRIGPAAYNEMLSKRRAQAVADYLASKGVSAMDMQVAGKGSSAPLVACEGKRGRSLIECLGPNRRTQIEFSAFEMIEEGH
jgi:OOP family OmpA-OmpF porin